MVAALGGPADFLDKAGSQLPRAAVEKEVGADGEGYLSAVDTHAIGNAIIELGGGRRTLGEKLDHATGFSHIARIGTRIDAGQPLAVVHAATDELAAQAAELFRAACTLAPDPPPKRPVVYRTLRAE